MSRLLKKWKPCKDSNYFRKKVGLPPREKTEIKAEIKAEIKTEIVNDEIENKSDVGKIAASRERQKRIAEKTSLRRKKNKGK